MLERVHFDEAKQSQLPALELLLSMGYQYLSVEEVLRQRGGDTSNFILSDIAAKKLMELNGYEVDGTEYKFTEKDVREAIDELEHIQYEGLIDTSRNLYNIIMPTAGGKTIRVQAGGKTLSKNFRFIDFQHPENNAFHVTAEFTAAGKQNIRVDIVCFVNGIPFAVIENKKGSVAVKEAIDQMVRNQGPEYAPKLFTYTQLLVSTNNKELLYGTTGTPFKFYAPWKERGIAIEEVDARVTKLIKKSVPTEIYQQILMDLNGYTDGYKQKLDRLPTEQDRGILDLFEPARLLDLTKNYILYEAGVKKLSRYQQYFAIHKMLERIEEKETTESGITRRRGGLVWHTQGSGKSLTMVMFVKALIENPHIKTPRVIIVTDRKDLDKQIKDTFKNCNLKKEVIQATSGENLLKLIKEKNLAVITTLVHKFESASKKKTGIVDTDENIFVLIDEAHRSQGGMANVEMQRIIPNACYIGFTGTPLMKNEKASWKKFGGYIDKYTIDDALADGIVLHLVYEGRYVPLEQNAEQIDRLAERVFEPLPKKYQSEGKKHVSPGMISSNPQRIEEIAHDIEKHFLKNFHDTGLKGQVVAPSKYAAVTFQKYFESRGMISTAVVISDEHDDGDEADLHKKEVVIHLDKVRAKHSSVASYEKEVIENFKNREDGEDCIELLIVVDKLLTGFDAPCNTVLYLAKDLRDHNLLQAIARVNRLHENKKLPKTVGFIIDYSENAKNIDTAMKLFGNYDSEDVQGALIDVIDKKHELEEKFAKLEDLFKEVKGSTDDEAYLRTLSDEPKRDQFYEAFNDFVRTFNECLSFKDFATEFQNMDLYQRELRKFLELRKTSVLRYATDVDLTEYKMALQNILDTHIKAAEIELLTKQISITENRTEFEEALDTLGSDASKAEAIAAQTEKTISERMDSDPVFYERFSKKIHDILEKMREGKLADVAALKQLKLIETEVVEKKDDSLPTAFAGDVGGAILYRNLKGVFESHGVTEEMTITIAQAVSALLTKEAIVDWYKNAVVKKQMQNVLDDYLYDVVKNELGVEFGDAEREKLIGEVLQLAENNHEIFT